MSEQKRKDLDFSLEKKLASEGFCRICGIDEAGRGPLCGPVVAAACVLPPDAHIEGLNDSKKLTPHRRDELFEIIKETALDWAVAEASVEEIDELNILEATLLAMRRAVASLHKKPDRLLVDGNVFRGFDIPGEAVIGGDGISPSIAAASILAKVTRDRICIELDRMYPQYGIAKHKGYCTAAHREALFRYGPAPIYRKQFIRFLNDSSHAQTPSAGVKASHGRFGEDAAAQYLTDNGYTIKGRNVRFGRHELDIIAEDDEYIVFVEVKTRTEAPAGCLYTYGRPASAVTYGKKQNTVAAASEYLRENRSEKRARIDVIEVYLERGTEAPAVSKINHIRNAFGAR